MVILPKLSIKPSSFLAEIDKPLVEITQKCKACRRVITILKNDKVRELIFPFFKTPYKATVIKTVYSCSGWTKVSGKIKSPI